MMNIRFTVAGETYSFKAPHEEAATHHLQQRYTAEQIETARLELQNPVDSSWVIIGEAEDEPEIDTLNEPDDFAVSVHPDSVDTPIYPRTHKPHHPVHGNLISYSSTSTRATDAELSKAIAAAGKQLAEHIAPIWGPVPALEFVPRGGTSTPGAMLAKVSDTPDQPGAAGYHAEGPDGNPYIKVFTFEGASTLKGADALSVTITHENAELTVDAPANEWVDGPDADYAKEIGDPVEGDTYEIDGVSVSNFVYPAYFDPQANPNSKFDYLEKLKAPFTMTPRGYLIKRTEPGNISQVFASHKDQGHDAHALGHNILIVFGAEYPEHKKAEKIAKAIRRRVPQSA